MFNDRLSQSIERAKRQNNELALFFIDLDRFKKINDSLGHVTGDKVLQEVATRLKNAIRKEDSLARLGGDEFTILIEELERGQDASLLAKKILQSLAEPIYIDEHTLFVSSSIGISLYPQDDIDMHNLLKYADAAMYKAKDEGRNNFQFYSSEMTALAFEHIVMETKLRQALAQEEFVVYYQPQVNAVTGKIIGMEALIRWNDPESDMVPPNKFVPIAEETGLIVPIDQWVMKTAIKQVAQWHEKGLNPGVLSLNLAIKQLYTKEFTQYLQGILKTMNFQPEWLGLEVTEGQIMSNPEDAIAILEKLSAMGVVISVDDFGTGYSSLSYLKRLPINKLKIDQSFIRGLPSDDEDAGISRAVIALAKSLNLDVIAEGVETMQQKDFLVSNGCENIQGYFYARPMPAIEMEVLLLGALQS
ncbi:putative bifunctional diguanylate cyclase/phosphodiesterase [sulfur-oxidizing endosymbiont of Gigantopelta aegis]|uniref:putative bifunctional diguanylate cyclase/phosphodiesterase n=1 Tax=sulfur-oxidizing endosymbiont of Gigantopelta aegis TaxID=2794934 RepID=UPI001FEA51D8|nr:EAL domain-containing protein [sulfur-oxidizing endosymbiont of Gigantopelta aegis]